MQGKVVWFPATAATQTCEAIVPIDKAGEFLPVSHPEFNTTAKIAKSGSTFTEFVTVAVATDTYPDGRNYNYLTLTRLSPTPELRTALWALLDKTERDNLVRMLQELTF